MPMLAPVTMTALPRSPSSNLDIRRYGAAFLEGSHELGTGFVRHADGWTAVPDVDDLGQDADGDLRRRHGADVDADGRLHLGQVVQRDAFVLQQLEDGEDAPPAADHADVGQRLLDDLPQ